MLTVLEALNLSTEFFRNKGMESPRINAELLLGHILKLKRLELYLSFDRPLTQEEIDLYREFVKRRSRFEPLQYIIGIVEFYGLKFMINPSVLIPRPETEILVETVIESSSKEKKIKILDIGAGSGIISISISKNLPNADVTGIDNSTDALITAESNAALNHLKNINFIQKDILNGSSLDNKFDIIVSNPPYVSIKEFPSLQPELKVYEPKHALTDYGDGLNFYRIISSKAKDILLPGGKIFFEMGKGQSDQVRGILIQNNFSNIIIKKDYQNIDRVISGELI